MHTSLTHKRFLLCITAGLLLNAGSSVAEHHAEAETPATESAPVTEQSSDTATVTLDQYNCSLQGLVRRVEISYADEGTKVPCDVNYYKDSEAPEEMSTLWSAQNLEGYCEQKAEEFVAKLQSWGWSCTTK
ncbi:hypothetical protein [Teredinibacter purpureus]|uniref:hypothetical protein n=1 Tax=Teredinibacter purpureus TaxID=2731756 RepID=UPI000696110F|nr:hypothetical protein [Teredinibacter purpureus]